MPDHLIRLEHPSPSPALRTLAGNFGRLSGDFIAQGEARLELARAAGDEEAIVREHIKIEVMRAARTMFAGSYRAVSGEAAWADGDASARGRRGNGPGEGAARVRLGDGPGNRDSPERRRPAGGAP